MVEQIEGLIDYPGYIQETLRGVIPKILKPIAETGVLPGEHHFFITFGTAEDGVKIPSSLRAQYPDKMTIVIQREFSHLIATDEGFGVQLKFSGTPTDLYIPYVAITAFVDPSVNFGIQFEPTETDSQDGPEAKLRSIPPSKSPAAAPAKSRAAPPSKGAAKSDSAGAKDRKSSAGDNVVQVDFSRKD